jgi:hypothetical protein
MLPFSGRILLEFTRYPGFLEGTIHNGIATDGRCGGSAEPFNDGEWKMINLSNITAGLVLGLVLTSAVPAFAGNSRVVPGHNARAQVIEQSIGGDGIVSPERARALRECNEKAAGFRDYTWGHAPSDLYRSCMAARGEVE